MAFLGRFVFKPNGEGLLYYDIIIPAVSISVLATIDHSYSLHIHTLEVNVTDIKMTHWANNLYIFYVRFV